MHPNRWRAARILLMVGTVGCGEAAAKEGPFLPLLQTGGREAQRDPFRVPAAEPDAPPPAGLAGVGVTEARIRGIVRSLVPPDGEAPTDAAAWAILESPGGEGFVAAPGDRLLDGVLGLIEDGGVVFWLDGDPGRRVFRPLAAPAVDAGEGA